MFFDAEDGTELYVTDQGPRNAQTIVLVHGLLANFGFWRNNVPDLARHFRVITIDMRGHGFSSKPNVGDTPLQVARDVHALLVQLNLSRVTLVGWSAGAHVVHRYIETFGSDRLESVCLVDMSPKMICDETWSLGLHLGPGAPLTQEVFNAVRAGFEQDDFNTRQGLIPLLFAVDDQPSESGEKLVKNRSVIARSVSARCRHRYDVASDTQEFFSRNFNLATTAGVVSHWDELGAGDFRAQIRNFPSGLGVLLTYGSQSALFPHDVGQWIFDNLPTGTRKQLKLFDESGHSPHWEEPTKFNRVLAAFVR